MLLFYSWFIFVFYHYLNPFMYLLLTAMSVTGENTTPTMAEVTLPWKRPEDEVVCDQPLRQSEFPGWASNKEYVCYDSPTNTFLGKCQ